MTWTTRLLVLGALAVASFMGALSISAPSRAQEADPQQVVEDFFDAVDAGDVEGAAALLSDSFIFTNIDESEGSFAAVGKPAFTSVIEEVVALNNQTELSDLAVDGLTVTGVAAFSDDESDAAGVDRYLQPFVITLDDSGLVVRAEFTYDQTDQQTADFLEYQAEQGGGDDGEEPPGALTIPLAAQPGGNQAGEALIFEEEGLSFVGVFVEPGPEGVQQPAHFHTGTCAAPGPVVQPLANVLDGGSFTLLSVGNDELVDAGLIINVHKSTVEPGIYVSCGEVLSAAAPTPTVPAAPTVAAPTATPVSGIVAPDTGTGAGNSGGSAGDAVLVMVLGLSIALAGIGLRLARAR